MPLTLYLEHVSPPCRAVLMAIEALGISVDYVTVKMTEMEHHKAEFLKKNPVHTIPVLEDESTIICDSHAIMAYLVSKYSKDDSLYPKDLKKRAMVDQKLHFDTGHLFSHLRGFVKKCFSGRSKIIEQHERNTITECYGWLENFLNETPYIAGDCLTIADFSAITSLTALMVLVPLEETEYPKITHWIKKMQELPYYEKVIESGRGDMVAFLSSISDVVKD